MRRQAAIFFLAAAMSATAFMAVPSTAHAVAVCVGQGVLQSGPMYHHVIVTTPPFSPTTGVRVTAPVTTGFGASIVLGTCAGVTTTPSPQLTLDTLFLAGIKSGWCGQSTGMGVTNHGRGFAWVEVGSKMVFTGAMVGLVSAYFPNVLAGQSCLTGATEFIMGWSVFAESHCFTKSKTSTTLPIPTTSTTPFPNVDVRTGPVNYWLNLCLPNPVL